MTISLYEDNAGTLSVTDGARTWVFVGGAPANGSFSADAAAMAAGQDDDWLDSIGPLDDAERADLAPQGAEVARWSPETGVSVLGPLGSAAQFYIGSEPTDPRTFPALVHADASGHTVVFCQAVCRSAYDGPTSDLDEVVVSRLRPTARCYTCGRLLLPELVSQCEACGRGVYYDEGDERYHHLEVPAIGCFLIGPAGDDPGGWTVQRGSDHFQVAVTGMASLRRALAVAADELRRHAFLAASSPPCTPFTVAGPGRGGHRPPVRGVVNDPTDWALDCPDGGFPPALLGPGPWWDTLSGRVPHRYGWVAVPVRVHVRIDFATGQVDRMHLRPETDGSVVPLGPGETISDALLDWAEGDGMDETEASESLRVVNHGNWPVLASLPPGIEWGD